MAMTRVKPEAWFKFGNPKADGNVDVDISGKANIVKLMEERAKAEKAAQAAREALETAIGPLLLSALQKGGQETDGMTLIYSYRFGPSFGLIPEDAKATKGGKKRLGLKV